MVAPHRHTPGQAAAIAKAYLAEHHPQAACCYIGGSYFRGMDTAYSDVDMLIVYPQLPQAYRHSFVIDDLPIEYFAHDLETLDYILARDLAANRCTQQQIVADAVVTCRDKTIHDAVLARLAYWLNQGPKKYTREEIDKLRYTLTDRADDLRAPRNGDELLMAAISAYPVIEELFFACHHSWRWGGKWLPRKADALQPGFTQQIHDAYRDIATGDAHGLLALSEQLLARCGGPLWDGYRAQMAPEERLKLPENP